MHNLENILKASKEKFKLFMTHPYIIFTSDLVCAGEIAYGIKNENYYIVCFGSSWILVNRVLSYYGKKVRENEKKD